VLSHGLEGAVAGASGVGQSACVPDLLFFFRYDRSSPVDDLSPIRYAPSWDEVGFCWRHVFEPFLREERLPSWSVVEPGCGSEFCEAEPEFAFGHQQLEAHWQVVRVFEDGVWSDRVCDVETASCLSRFPGWIVRQAATIPVWRRLDSYGIRVVDFRPLTGVWLEPTPHLLLEFLRLELRKFFRLQKDVHVLVAFPFGLVFPVVESVVQQGSVLAKQVPHANLGKTFSQISPGEEKRNSAKMLDVCDMLLEGLDGFH